MKRRYPRHKPYNNYDGYNETPPEEKEYKKLTSFKDFDYEGYDVKKKRKADSKLMKVWKKIKSATSSRELQLAASMLLSILILIGKKGDNREAESALKDIANGRVDHGTLEDTKDALVKIYGAVTGKGSEMLWKLIGEDK